MCCFGGGQAVTRLKSSLMGQGLFARPFLMVLHRVTKIGCEMYSKSVLWRASSTQQKQTRSPTQPVLSRKGGGASTAASTAVPLLP